MDCGEVFTAVRSNAKRCPTCGHRHSVKVVEAKRPPRARVKNPGVGKGHYPRESKTKNVCRRCFTAFFALRSDAKWCPSCRTIVDADRSKRHEALTRKPCPDCGVAITRKSARCRDCDSQYRLGKKVGEESPSWKGGRTESKGYVWLRVTMPDGKRKYRQEHILAWEAVNGPVPPRWDVHHLNGVKDDNRPENLQAMSKSDHHSSKGLVPYEERIRHLEDRLVANGLTRE